MQGSISIEPTGTGCEAGPIHIRVASTRACGDTDQANIVNEVVGEALAHACAVAGDVLSVEIFGTDVDTKFDIGVRICEHLDCGISGTVVCADVIYRVSVLSAEA